MRTYYYTIAPYCHCATVCPYKEGVLLAFYSGPECHEDQTTHIYYLINGEIIKSYTLPPGTGNSVLCPLDKDNVLIIYSMFNKINDLLLPVDAWKYCTNWKSIISNELKVSDPIMLEIETGYLTRCNPIKINNIWYLPMYREFNPYGEILQSSDGFNWSSIGKIGDGIKEINGHFGSGILIQPTLWYDRQILHSLSRDVSQNRRAWYSYSRNLGETWSRPATSNIWNDNNSLIVIHDNRPNPLIVWNDGPGRGTLMLGQLYPNLKIRKIKLLNQMRASYPNYCFDQDYNLYIAHTDGIYIAVHMFTEQEYKRMLDV